MAGQALLVLDLRQHPAAKRGQQGEKRGKNSWLFPVCCHVGGWMGWLKVMAAQQRGTWQAEQEAGIPNF